MRKVSRNFRVMMGLGLTLLVAACASTPYTGRRQLLLMPEGSETSMGLQAFQQIKRQYRPYLDPAVNQQVIRVGQRLAQAVNRPDYRWEFVVFHDDHIANAFCLPGGKVGIFTGILKYTQDDAGLATVIAHEAAHSLARHTAERMSQSMLAQAGGLGLGLALGGANPYAAQAAMQGYGLGTQVGLLLPYSRTQEYEADRIGLILMAKAGYDPAGALAFWERMKEHQKGRFQPPQFLSTHPSGEDRLRALAAFLPTAQKLYVPAVAATPPPGWAPPMEVPAVPPSPAPPAPPREPPAPEPPAKQAPAPGPAPKAAPEPDSAPDDLELKPMDTRSQPAPPCGQWVPGANSK